MALFPDEELVNVTTVDGRTLPVPRSLAMSMQLTQASLGGQPAPGAAMPAQQPVVPQDLGVLQESQTPPNSVVDQMQAPAAPELVQNGEDFQVDTARLAKQRAAQQKAEQKQVRAQAAQAATPMGRLDAAQKQQNAAAEGVKEALLGANVIEQAEQDVAADVVAENNKTLNKLREDQAAEVAKITAARDAKMAEHLTIRKKMADTKIDRTLDHPIGLAIAAALVGIGQALGGKPIDAGSIITTAIDRKVAAQMADLDQMARVYGMSKEDLALIKDEGKSVLEIQGIMFAAEVDKAKRGIEEVTSRSASAKTRANGVKEMAILDQIAAQKATEALHWGLEFDQRGKHQDATIAESRANRGENRRQADMRDKLERDKMADDKVAAVAAAKARGDEASAKMIVEAEKEVRQLGMKGADNKYLLDNVGRQKDARAAKLEAEAAALAAGPNAEAASDAIALKRQAAAVLRGELVLHVVKHRSDTQAGALSRKLAATQNMQDNIDEIKILYEKVGRGYVLQSGEQQALASKKEQLNAQLKEVTGSGAWDKGLKILFDGITGGGDPSSGWEVGALGAALKGQRIKDGAGFLSALDSVALNSRRAVTLELNRDGTNQGTVTEDELFTRGKKAAAPNESAVKIQQAYSQTELDKDAPGAGENRNMPQPGESSVDFAARKRRGSDAPQSGTAGTLKHPGLSADQVAPHEKLLQAYKKGDASAGDELKRLVVENVNDRPDLSWAILQDIEQNAQKLYPAIRAAIPKDSEVDKRATIAANRAIGVAAQAQDVESLKNMVINTMGPYGNVTYHDGYAALARIKGDPMHPQHDLAKQAIMDITSRSGNIKMAPPHRQGR